MNRYAEGVAQSGFDDSGIAAAVALANASDVVVAVLGDGGEAVGYVRTAFLISYWDLLSYCSSERVTD